MSGKNRKKQNKTHDLVSWDPIELRKEGEIWDWDGGLIQMNRAWSVYWRDKSFGYEKWWKMMKTLVQYLVDINL